MNVKKLNGFINWACFLLSSCFFPLGVATAEVVPLKVLAICGFTPDALPATTYW